MQSLLSKYRVNAEYHGGDNNHNLTVGEKFDAEIEVNFKSGNVYLIIIRSLPDHTLGLRYLNFPDLETTWKIDRPFSGNIKPR